DQPDDESKSDRETKSFQRAGDGEPIAGYMNLGDFVVAQKTMRDYIAQKMPKTGALLADVPGLVRRRSGGRLFVAVSKKQIREFMERKAVPTIGTVPPVI